MKRYKIQTPKLLSFPIHPKNLLKGKNDHAITITMNISINLPSQQQHQAPAPHCSPHLHSSPPDNSDPRQPCSLPAAAGTPAAAHPQHYKPAAAGGSCRLASQSYPGVVARCRSKGFGCTWGGCCCAGFGDCSSSVGGGGGCDVLIPSSGGRRAVGGFCVGGHGRAGSRRRSRLLGGRRGWRLWCSGLRSRSVLRSVSL